MSNYKTHLFWGIIIVSGGFLILYKLNLLKLHYLFFIPYILFLSLISDVDHPKSKARKIVYTLLILSIITISFTTLFKFIYILFITIPIVLIFIIENLKHRSKLTHNSITGLILSLPLLYFSFGLFIIAFSTFLSHLFLDSL